MRVLALLFVALALFSVELKIASFNVENLFDGENNGNEYSDFRIENGQWNEAKYLAKLDKISSEITALNADIIALQEIENAEVLKALADKTNYKFYKFSTPPTAPVGVGILSRVPIKSSEFYRMEDVKTRDILRADFAFGSENFSLYVVHMLSARNPLAERKKSFAYLNKIVKNKKNSIILGDFNAGFGKKSLLGELLVGGGYVDLWAVDECSKQAYNACRSHDSGALLDHILLSRDFFGARNFGYKVGSFSVKKDEHFSDHFPLSFVLSDIDVLETTPDTSHLIRKSGPKNLVYKEVNINEIYDKVGNLAFVLKDAVVTYTDRYGGAVSQDGRGVYVHGLSDVKIGDKIDLAVEKTHKYKQNFEISEFKILSRHGNVGDIRNFTLKAENIPNLRAGDVVNEIRGNVRDGYITIDGRKFQIFSRKGKLKNAKNVKFKNAYFTIYNGEKEFIIE